MRYKHWIAGVLLAGTSAPAFAQAEGSGAAADEGAAAPGIVVTAERRSQSAFTPISSWRSMPTC
jgi:iron complex outermembrane receptor protein